MAHDPEQEERDRKTGLRRILDAIDQVSRRLDVVSSEVHRLHDRIDALESASRNRDPVPAVVDTDVLRTAVRQAVDALEVPSTVDDLQALVTTALSVLPAPRLDEGLVAAAVRDAVGTLAVDLSPVLDALADVEHRLPELAGRTEQPAVAAVEPDEDRLDADVVLDIVRRTVAASHRALVTQLRDLLAETGRVAPAGNGTTPGDQATLDAVALDVEAIRRAIERAGGTTR